VRFPEALIHGRESRRLPGLTCFSIPGTDSEAVLIALDLVGICASSGAACTTGSLEPSHVLEAMGIAPALTRGAIRISFGRSNATADVLRLLGALDEIVPRVREANDEG
jgi:cysteine desulfurase